MHPDPVQLCSCALPSSAERTAAASIADSSAARTACFSSSRIAAMVVPPGDVTASRSSVGCSPESRSMMAAPTADWMISSADTARGNPSRMPASIIASTRKKKYAGPGQRGDRVLLRLRHPNDLADRGQQILDELQVFRIGMRAGGDGTHRLAD